MKRFITILSVVVLFLSWPSLAGEHTKPFKMTLWGTSGIPLGTTLDGNPIGTGLCRGDSNFGKFECTTTGYAVPDVDSKRGVIKGSKCPEGSAWEVPFKKIVENHIVRFENGDVLWMYPVVDPNLSYVCFDASFSPTAQVKTWDFEGGSGRFKGADGQATWVLTGDPIPMGKCPDSDSNVCLVMYAVHPGPFEGYITLQ